MTHNRVHILIAIALSAVAFNYAWTLNKEIQQRTTQQQASIGEWTNWQQQVARYQPLEKRWKETLPSSGQLADQYRIVQHIGVNALGLTLPEMPINIGTIEEMKWQDKPLGFHTYPISNTSDSIQFHAPDFATAYNAALKLKAREDIRFERVKLSAENGKPTLTLTKFAIIVRD